MTPAEARAKHEIQNVKATLQAVRDGLYKVGHEGLSLAERNALLASVERSLKLLGETVGGKTTYELLRDAQRRSEAAKQDTRK